MNGEVDWDKSCDLREEDRHICDIEVADLMNAGDGKTDFPAIAFIEMLNDALEQIPEEFRSTAVVRLAAYGDYASSYLDVHYWRPETDDEYHERLHRHQREKTNAEAHDHRYEPGAYKRQLSSTQLALLSPKQLYRSPAMWQPISTAPKGKTILLFAVTDIGDNGEIKNWKMATGHRFEVQYDDATGWHWDGHEVKVYDVKPTHWQPLPEPPTL